MGELAAPPSLVAPGLADPEPGVLRAALRAWETLHGVDAVPPVPDACRTNWTFRHHRVHLDWLVHGRTEFGVRPVRPRLVDRDTDALRRPGSEALGEAVRAYADDATRPKAAWQRFGLPVDPVASLFETFLSLLDAESAGLHPDEGPLGNRATAASIARARGLRG